MFDDYLRLFIISLNLSSFIICLMMLVLIRIHLSWFPPVNFISAIMLVYGAVQALGLIVDHDGHPFFNHVYFLIHFLVLFVGPLVLRFVLAVREMKAMSLFDKPMLWLAAFGAIVCLPFHIYVFQPELLHSSELFAVWAYSSDAVYKLSFIFVSGICLLKAWLSISDDKGIGVIYEDKTKSWLRSVCLSISLLCFLGSIDLVIADLVGFDMILINSVVEFCVLFYLIVTTITFIARHYFNLNAVNLNSAGSSNGELSCAYSEAENRCVNDHVGIQAGGEEDNNGAVGSVESDLKYRNSGLSSEHADRIVLKIERLMEHEKVYMDASLNLEYLSQELSEQPQYVSQAINQKLGVNFFELLASYRIREAKERLRNEPDKAVLDIAMDVGFQAKSSFNRTFKKITGVTPSAFRKLEIGGTTL